jgi:hypothetical protein
MSISFKNKTVDPSHFAMIPRADIPRSVFQVESGHKTTFDAGYLVPVYMEEVLPGDSFKLHMTAFCRMATPIFPLMDNLELCSFFFFVPNRLLWSNWQKFMGEQVSPGDSISYLVPQCVFATGGEETIFDYFGLPTNPISQYNFNALPLRAYNLIWNQWFRDENLQNSVTVNTGDGPDTQSTYTLLRRGKRHDYFTSALPFAQKGTAPVVPLGGQATVLTSASPLVTGAGKNPMLLLNTAGGAPNNLQPLTANASKLAQATTPATGTIAFDLLPSNLYADLSTATGATINALRQSFQIQKLLERDARGGTRYTEILRAHFGVISPDARLQRPEYLGGGCSPININPVAQTSGTASQPTPLGNLAGVGTGVAQHGFSKSFVEHGYVIGLVNVRAPLSYQQGLDKRWSRQTRYDFYWPEFAHLGEQAVLNQEIYFQGDSTGTPTAIFGYQERYAEYRYKPSQITGKFRSSATGTLDAWHLAQSFSSQPVLNATFIQDTPPVSRVVAAGTQANGQQFLFDSVFENRLVRPMPMYGVPGFIDRF